MERFVYEIGDIVKLKKPHPCGSQEWEILRVGADFRLKCQGCGHQIMVSRKLVEKNTKGLTKKEGQYRQSPQKQGLCLKNAEKHLPCRKNYGKVYIRDIFQFLAPFSERGQRPQGGAKRMNKYELAVVVSAKLEDDARTATVEKVKEYITRFGGTITNVDEWGKKKLAYDIQKMSEGFYYFIQFDAEATCPAELERHVRIMENVLRYLCVRQDA